MVVGVCRGRRCGAGTAATAATAAQDAAPQLRLVTQTGVLGWRHHEVLPFLTTICPPIAGVESIAGIEVGIEMGIPVLQIVRMQIVRVERMLCRLCLQLVQSVLLLQLVCILLRMVWNPLLNHDLVGELHQGVQDDMLPRNLGDAGEGLGGHGLGGGGGTWFGI